MPVAAISEDQPFDNDDWRALARGDAAAQNRLIARFSPKLRRDFEAGIRSEELRLDAEEETFHRVFSLFLSGSECINETNVAEFVNGISRNVMSEFQRVERTPW